MKLLSTIVAMLLLTGMATAQDNYTASNEGWLVDVNEAYEKSRETGKPIMANFTGSDWCGWCKKLTKSVFSKSEFKEWAEDNVVLLELDFPKRKKLPENIKKQNIGLQQALGVRGYPTIWVFYLEPQEQTKKFQIKTIGKTGYKSSVQSFISEVDNMIQGAN